MPNSSSPLFDRGVLNKFYYKSGANLSIRISSWKNYGVNKQTLYNWLWSLLDSRGIFSDNRSSVLDVGCGTGEMLSLFKKRQKNLNIFGLDISPAMIEKATYKNKNSKQNFFLSDIIQLPFKNGSFDVTTAVFVLHHVSNLSRSIRELMRVTKNGGIVLIADGDYNIKGGLNAVHYEVLKTLRFPSFMLDTTAYLRTSKKHISYIIDNLHYKKTLHIYKNKMVFNNVSQVLRYYRSAMMYRNSHGPQDRRISFQEWSRLLKEVESKIFFKIKKDGNFMIPGNVYCYLISKK